MGKSLAATLFALLVKDGIVHARRAGAGAARGGSPGDPRARHPEHRPAPHERRAEVPRQPGARTRTARYPDHYYIYTGGIDAFDYSITRPQEYPPNTDGRYRNSDPLTITYLAKLAVTKRRENFLTWPQRALFDRIGIRRQVLETDPYGNFLITGYDYGTARNWARIGLLYLQDGVWQGQRVLPEGWTTFVRTPAPAWKRPEYGAFFWLNRDRDVEPAARDLLRGWRRRAEHLDRAVAGPRHRPHGPYARPARGATRHESCAWPGDGGGGRDGSAVNALRLSHQLSRFR